MAERSASVSPRRYWRNAGGIGMAAGVLLSCVATPESSSDVASVQQSTVFCPADWTTLTTSPGQPYNAVGLLDNGCTATLIDSNHILAASHCFSNNGVWATSGLQFYPNFHPDRVPVPGALNVPRMDVTRAVVGQQVLLNEEGNDWGIAYVTNPQSTAGLDLTPAALWDTSASNLALRQVGYPRAWFVNGGGYNPTADVVGAWTCNQWLVNPGNAPATESVNCNQRWQTGHINFTWPPNSCTVTNWNAGSTGAAKHNCDASPGNSGSPLLAQNPAQGYQVQVVGVHWGGGTNHFASNPPIACDGNPNNGATQNGAVAVKRFINAPRFATNVAVARRSDGAAATAVFAPDGDRYRVTMRSRLGGAPYYYDAFDFWQDIGAPGSSYLSALGPVAACNQTPANPTPRVFAMRRFAGSYSQLLTSVAPFAGGWTDFSLPGSGLATDIDANREVVSGRCQVYVVRGGALYTRWMTSESDWSAWATVHAANGYTRVTAENNLGVFWVFMLDSNGRMWYSKYTGSWTAPAQVGFPGGVTAWTDLDLGYGAGGGNPDMVIYAYANDAANKAKLWRRVIPNTGNWGSWQSLNTTLYCPQGNCPVAPPPPVLTTITASRWMEDPAGTTTPAVFGTDGSGNVYHLSNGLLGSLGTEWKTFYSEYVP